MSRLLTSSGYVEFTSLCAILIIISARAKCEMILHLDDNISMMKSAIIEFISTREGFTGAHVDNVYMGRGTSELLTM